MNRSWWPIRTSTYTQTLSPLGKLRPIPPRYNPLRWHIKRQKLRLLKSRSSGGRVVLIRQRNLDFDRFFVFATSEQKVCLEIRRWNFIDNSPARLQAAALVADCIPKGLHFPSCHQQSVCDSCAVTAILKFRMRVFLAQ
jgi:hypothetical protein